MNNLKELRKLKGATQKDVGDYIGVSFQTYSRYEKGIFQPDHETLAKIAEYFGVSVDYLLAGAPVIVDSETNRRIEENILEKFSRHFINSNTLDFFISKNIYTKIPFEFEIDNPNPKLINEKLYKVDLPFYYQEKGKPVFCFIVNDYSMSPNYFPGDIIIARKEFRIKENDHIVVNINKEDAVIREVRSIDDKYYLYALDKNIKPIEYILSVNINYVGIVIESRKLRVPLNYLGYIE